MRGDPLNGLLDLADVTPALARARAAVDAAYARPAVRRAGAGLADEISLRSAVASAALEGSRYEVEEVRAGTVTDPVAQGALRCARELPVLVARWRQAPRQVLARLHLLAARGVVAEAALGRPATRPPAGPAIEPSAEFSAGPSAAPAWSAARLDVLFDTVLRGSAPGLLRAAVVHGELLALRAFSGPNGVLARAVARLELMAGGFDPQGLIAIEAGHLAREPEYVGAAGAFATGTADGVRAWLRHCAAAAEIGAAELVERAG